MLPLSTSPRRIVSVLACSLNQIPGDLHHNVGNILAAIREARLREAKVVLTTELGIIGYGVEDGIFDLDLVWRSAKALFEVIAPETSNLLLVVGLPIFLNNSLYNGAAVIHDRTVLGVVLKKHLAQDGPLYEARHFKSWPGGTATWLNNVPVGSLLFEIAGLRLGIEMCEEAWVIERAGIELVQSGAKIILNPSCSPYYPGKREVRNRIATDLSQRGHCGYVYASQMGVGGGTVPSDPYALVAAKGRIVSPSPDLYFGEEAYACGLIDIDDLDRSAAACASFRGDLSSQGLTLVKPVNDPICLWVSFPLSPGKPQLDSHNRIPAWRENNPPERAQLIELFHMLCLSTFWYLVRSKQQGWLLPLSGGRDSALVLIVLSLGLELALRERGWELLAQTLEHVHGVNSLPRGDIEALKKLLIHTYYIKGEASSTATANAARRLASIMSATHHEVDSTALVGAAKDSISRQTSIVLSWSNPKQVVALENLATGMRFLLARFFSNLDGRILVVTANLTEMAEGYYTIGADANGGYAPLTSLHKTTVIALLELLMQGWEGVSPIYSINSVLTSGPATAELQPQHMNQTDEGFMGPFAVVDVMINCLLGSWWSVRQVFFELVSRFPDYGPWELYRWLERLCTRWANSQFKRYQAAPGPRLCNPDLMSQVGTRYPIISGGFKDSLALLKLEVEELFGAEPEQKHLS